MRLNIMLKSFLCWSLIFISSMTYAQKNELKKFSKNFEVGEFNAIEAGATFKFVFIPGSIFEVRAEGPQIAIDHLEVENNAGQLEFSTQGSFSYNGNLLIYLKAPSIEKIQLGGVAEFIVLEGEILKGEQIAIELSGASKVKGSMDVGRVKIEASGASYVNLTGHSSDLNIEASGASDLKLSKFKADNAKVEASGASDVDVYVNQILKVETSGIANLSYNKDVANVLVNDETAEFSRPRMPADEDGDNIRRVKVGGVNVLVDDGNGNVNVRTGLVNVDSFEGDSVNIRIGERKFKVDSEGNVSFKRNKVRRRFNGHYAGFELGINGYLNKDLNMDFSPDYSFLDLKMEKSINVNINAFEQNIALSKSGRFGMLTGIGLSINNYRFSKQTHLDKEADVLKGYYVKGVDLRKTKIVNTFLTIPVLFEYQSKTNKKFNRFFIQAGAQFGLRVQTHTKEYFESTGSPYSWVDPVSGEVVDNFQSSGENKLKQHDSFYMNPIKVDATVRVGWGIINLYGTYSITNMLQKAKGPELHPFSVGLILVSW